MISVLRRENLDLSVKSCCVLKCRRSFREKGKVITCVHDFLRSRAFEAALCEVHTWLLETPHRTARKICSCCQMHRGCWDMATKHDQVATS